MPIRQEVKDLLNSVVPESLAVLPPGANDQILSGILTAFRQKLYPHIPAG